MQEMADQYGFTPSEVEEFTLNQIYILTHEQKVTMTFKTVKDLQKAGIV